MVIRKLGYYGYASFYLMLLNNQYIYIYIYIYMSLVNCVT